MNSRIINAETGIYAILGDPISHSMSPVIMNNAFCRLHMDKVFLAFRVGLSNVDQVMQALKTVDIKGYVFTMPLKEHIGKHLDYLKDEAEIMGAVNCVGNVNGILTGYNTDSIGFWHAIQRGNPEKKRLNKLFILGAGAFAKAAATQAALQGTEEIVVTNILSQTIFVDSFHKFLDRLLKRVPNVRVKLIGWDKNLWMDELIDVDVVANATSNGLKGKGDLDKQFPYDVVNKEAIFFDAIYDPLETEFLKTAKQKGFRTVDGLELLVHQGACAFKIWTGIDVNPADMKKGALEFLRSSK